MTLLALDLGVFPLEFVFGGFMLEGGRFKTINGMAFGAVFPFKLTIVDVAPLRRVVAT